MKIYACKISQSSEQTKKGQQSVLSRHLLRYAYESEKRDIPWEQLSIKKTQNGKPYFANSKDLFFSISHSKEYVAVVLADIPVGIDIEKIRPYQKRIVERFFSEEEQKRFLNLREERKQQLFYEIWCGKEACSKIDGIGMSKGLSRLCILNETIAINLENKKHMLLKNYDAIEEYQCTCAVFEQDYIKNNTCFCNEIQIVDIEQFTSR